MSSKPGLDEQGDFNDVESLKRAFAGVDTIFLLLPLVPNKLQLADNAVAAGPRRRCEARRAFIRSRGRSTNEAATAHGKPPSRVALRPSLR